MIKIDEEFKSLIPPLTDEEYKILKMSIEKEGIRDSIHTWDNIIVDGHNRYSISQELGIECPSREMNFASRDDALIWIIQNQFGRRNLSSYQRSILALKLEPLLREHKESQRIEKISEFQRTGEIMQKSAPSITTREELAKVAGVSHDTIAKVKRIESSDNQEVKEKVREGTVSINKADNIIRGIVDIPKPVKKDERRKTEIDEDSIVMNAISFLKMRLTGFDNTEQKKRIILNLKRLNLKRKRLQKTSKILKAF